jgi:hypothetical protein
MANRLNELGFDTKRASEKTGTAGYGVLILTKRD